MGNVIKHHSDQQDGIHPAINKMMSDHHVVMGKGFRVMGRHFSMVHGHLASQTKRLDAFEQRLTELHKTVELRLESMRIDQARKDYERCEARAQTDQKLDLILKYMAGFDCEISDMKIQIREMKTAIGAMARMSFRRPVDWKMWLPDSMLLKISTKLETTNLEIATAGQDAELTHV